MLLYFKTSNHFSFDEEITFSTVAGKYATKDPVTKEKKDELPENLIPINKYDVDLLRTSLVYGANASGKSNLLRAIVNSHLFIQGNFSGANSPTYLFNYFHNFHNQNEEVNLQRPIAVTFGILIDDTQFEYAFTLIDSRIVSEILIEYRTQKPIEHFFRGYNSKTNEYEWRFSKYFTGQKDAVKNITNQYSLFLTVGSVSKLPVCEKVFKWFSNLFFSIDEINPGTASDYYTLKEIYTSKETKDFVLEQLKEADFNIIDIDIQMEGDKITNVTTTHKTLDKNGLEVTPKFDYYSQESVGTRRFIGWLGYIMSVVSNNFVFLIDEFGVSMHSLLTKHLLNVMNRNKTDGTSNRAQFIFTTHDTNLMTRELFRPDQIWIVEKDGLSNSKLYSLSQFKSLKGQDLETAYLQGLYGGIPHFKTDTNE